jgi:cytochrome c biogenesis protein CcmG/thiol:disulfide interchange protein DsbE
VTPNFVLVALLMVALVPLGASVRDDQNPLSVAKTRKRLSSFSLPRLRFPDWFLASSRVLGEVTRVNVGATRCVHCCQANGVPLEIARSGEVPIYGLNYKDDRDLAIRWLDQLGDPFVSTGYDVGGRVGAKLGNYGVPETHVLRPNGSIACEYAGTITDKG